ncbi:MAG: hypothetical protein LKK00_09005 [Intestinimonas sp.]|jgi:hypothetical protein|nr:hypothetical protein [Intestinimonas sp.]
MLRLKATKTSLYKLAASYETLPGMHKTKFIKAPRARDWWLKWSDRNAFCEAFLSVCMGTVLLAVEKRDWDGNRISREVYHIKLESLRELGMIEEGREGRM